MDRDRDREDRGGRPTASCLYTADAVGLTQFGGVGVLLLTLVVVGTGVIGFVIGGLLGVGIVVGVLLGVIIVVLLGVVVGVVGVVVGVVGVVVGVVGVVVGVLAVVVGVLGVVVGVLGIVVVDVTGVCIVDLTGVGVVDPAGTGVADPAGVLVVVIPAGPLVVDPAAVLGVVSAGVLGVVSTGFRVVISAGFRVVVSAGIRVVVSTAVDSTAVFFVLPAGVLFIVDLAGVILRVVGLVVAIAPFYGIASGVLAVTATARGLFNHLSERLAGMDTATGNRRERGHVLGIWSTVPLERSDRNAALLEFVLRAGRCSGSGGEKSGGGGLRSQFGRNRHGGLLSSLHGAGFPVRPSSKGQRTVRKGFGGVRTLLSLVFSPLFPFPIRCRGPQQPSWCWFSCWAVLQMSAYGENRGGWYAPSFLQFHLPFPCRFVVFRFIIVIVSSLLGAAFPVWLSIQMSAYGEKRIRGGNTHCAFFAGGLLAVSSAFEGPHFRTFEDAGAAFLGWHLGAIVWVWCGVRSKWCGARSKRCGGWEASGVVVGSKRLTWQLMGPAFLIRKTWTAEPRVGLY